MDDARVDRISNSARLLNSLLLVQISYFSGN